MTHMVPTQSEDKDWGLQMDLAPTETSPRKDRDGRIPLNHRKIIFLATNCAQKHFSSLYDIIQYLKP